MQEERGQTQRELWGVNVKWQEDHLYFILIPALLCRDSGHQSKLHSPDGCSVLQSPLTLQMVARTWDSQGSSEYSLLLILPVLSPYV